MLDSQPKTAVIFDPYLDTLGGGERYTLTVAQTLLNQGYQVILAWRDQATLKQATTRFGLPLEGLELSAEYYNLFSQKNSLLSRFSALKDIDLVFIVSDGSVPMPRHRYAMAPVTAPTTRPRIKAPTGMAAYHYVSCGCASRW